MNPFIHDDFLLESDPARALYHGHAAGMPIIDYHCHLDPRAIAEDRRWKTITEIWLYGDHYKWRAMRSNGIPERFCTGEADDVEKFQAWADTLEIAYRNPLYHWSHMELTRSFGIPDLLVSGNAGEIYERANARLREPDFSARGLIRASNVRVVCTTDDPVDDLRWHRQVREEETSFVMLPAWRPDRAMAVESPDAFRDYLGKLADAAEQPIRDFDEFLAALRVRHEFFHQQGCRLSDHGIERFHAADYRESDIAACFRTLRSGGSLSPAEVEAFKSCMLLEFGRMDHARGWVQQYHYGALRSMNSRFLEQVGRDSGFDSIGDFTVAQDMARFLDLLDRDDRLAPTILYNLNPSDNYLLSSMIGNFQDGSRPGKIQFGSGWWFLDQLDGMTLHIEALSQLGLLHRFVGMLTDSRSFLSYSRHEYFRRLLCNIVGDDVARGRLPWDEPRLGRMIRDICYHNAARYFDFGLDPDSTPYPGTSP